MSITLSASLSVSSSKFLLVEKCHGTLGPPTSPRHRPDSERALPQRTARKRTSRKSHSSGLFFAITKLLRDRTSTDHRRPREAASARAVCARSESLQSPRRTGSWSSAHTQTPRTRLSDRCGRRFLSKHGDAHVFGNHAQRITDVAKELRPARTRRSAPTAAAGN